MGRTLGLMMAISVILSPAVFPFYINYQKTGTQFHLMRRL